MKKAIIGTLAVVGGITLVSATALGIVVAIAAIKEKKLLAKMSPEEREQEKNFRNEVVDSLMKHYCKKRNDQETEVSEDVAEAVLE